MEAGFESKYWNVGQLKFAQSTSTLPPWSMESDNAYWPSQILVAEVEKIMSTSQENEVK